MGQPPARRGRKVREEGGGRESAEGKRRDKREREVRNGQREGVDREKGGERERERKRGEDDKGY